MRVCTDEFVKAKYCCILIVMSSHPLDFGMALLAVTFCLTINKQKTYPITAETSSGTHLLSLYYIYF
jgi:hypothetical protein